VEGVVALVDSVVAADSRAVARVGASKWQN